MITKLQLEEIKDNLKYDLFELFDDYVYDIRVTILNEGDVVIAINDDDVSNHMRLSKTDFSDLDYQAFKKILNALVYYAQ